MTGRSLGGIGIDLSPTNASKEMRISCLEGMIETIITVTGRLHNQADRVEFLSRKAIGPAPGEDKINPTPPGVPIAMPSSLSSALHELTEATERLAASLDRFY